MLLSADLALMLIIEWICPPGVIMTVSRVFCYILLKSGAVCAIATFAKLLYSICYSYIFCKSNGSKTQLSFWFRALPALRKLYTNTIYPSSTADIAASCNCFIISPFYNSFIGHSVGIPSPTRMFISKFPICYFTFFLSIAKFYNKLDKTGNNKRTIK